jgi:hypothetical protein
MRHWALLFLSIPVLALSAPGCGEDRGTRGLQPANEEAVPTQEKDLRETEAQRQTGTIDQEQELETKEFDDAETR